MWCQKPRCTISCLTCSVHSIMKHLLLGRGNSGVIEVLEISPRQSTWTLFNFWNLLFWALSRPRPKFSPWILNVKSGMQSFLKTSRLSALSISQPIQQSREGWRQRWHQPSRHTGQYLGQEGLEPWDRLQLWMKSCEKQRQCEMSEDEVYKIKSIVFKSMVFAPNWGGEGC